MRKISSKLIASVQSGFTLIELVIVIVIIGILAAVAIPNFSSVTSDANAGLLDGLTGSVNSYLASEKALCQNPNRTAACGLPSTTTGGDCTAVNQAFLTNTGKITQLPFSGTAGTYTTDGTTCKIKFTPTTGTAVTANVAVIKSLTSQN